MPLAFAGDDATKALLDLAEENLRALEWFSGYLNLCPRFVSGEDVEALTRECGVTVGAETGGTLLPARCAPVGCGGLPCRPVLCLRASAAGAAGGVDPGV